MATSGENGSGGPSSSAQVSVKLQAMSEDFQAVKKDVQAFKRDVQTVKADVKAIGNKLDFIISFLQQGIPELTLSECLPHDVVPAFDHEEGQMTFGGFQPVVSFTDRKQQGVSMTTAPDQQYQSQSESSEESSEEEEEEVVEAVAPSLTKRTGPSAFSGVDSDRGTQASASNPVPSRDSPSASQQGKANFQTNLHLSEARAASPLPVRSEKVTIPSAVFKCSKTDRFDDNRHQYFSKMMNIVHAGVPNLHPSDLGQQTPILRLRAPAARGDGIPPSRPSEVSGTPKPSSNHTTPRSTSNSNKPGNGTSSSAEIDAPGQLPHQAPVASMQSPPVNGPTSHTNGNASQLELNSSTDSLTRQQNNRILSDSGLRHSHGNKDNRNDVTVYDDEASPILHLPSAQSQLGNHLRLTSGGSMTNGFMHSEERDGFQREELSPGESTRRKQPSQHLEDEGDGEEKDEEEVIQRLIEVEQKNAQHCTDSKSTGLDTVICLDTSASMAKTKDQIEKCIHEFIDGLEQNIIDHDLEENVALVTFGFENTIAQHLTNDYEKLRDALENVQYGGSSPLLVGLLLALAEIGKRGGQCSMSDHYVMPRIVLISDGFATDLLVPESTEANSEATEHIVSLVEGNSDNVDSISCVFLLKMNKNCLDGVAKASGGRLVPSSKISSLCGYFRIHTMVDKVMSRLKDVLEGMSPENVRSEIRKILTDIDKEEIEEVFKVVQTRYLKRFEFGTRVQYTQQPGNSTESTDPEQLGTIIGTPKKNCVKVLWDDGEMDRYELESLRVVTDRPRLLKDGEDIKPGIRVERGPDWREEYNAQADPSVRFGIAIKKENKVVHVMWPNANTGNYRYGYGQSKKYDIKICQGQKEKEDWLYEDTNGKWLPFSLEDSKNLEKVYLSKPTSTQLVSIDGTQYRVKLNQLLARNTVDPAAPELKVKRAVVLV